MKKEKKEKIIGLRMTPEQYNQVKELSVIHKLSVSKLIRAFVFSNVA